LPICCNLGKIKLERPVDPSTAKEDIFMSKLINSANEFIKQCQWTDIALLKFCLCALGIMIGLGVSKNKKKPVFITAFAVFIITYIPLMAKYLLVVKRYFTDCMEDSL